MGAVGTLTSVAIELRTTPVYDKVHGKKCYGASPGPHDVSHGVQNE